MTLVHRRNALRAEKILQDRLFRNPKISVVWNTLLEEVGEEHPLKVKGVVLRDRRTNARSERRNDGVFIAIGHTPASALFVGQLEMKASGYIKTAPSTATSVPGVFAAGDVTDDVYRQAVTAAGQGCMAACSRPSEFLAAKGEAEPAIAAE